MKLILQYEYASNASLDSVMDLEMTNFNAKERDIDDWNAIFTRVNPRLKIRNVFKPPGSVNSIIEVALEGGA